MKKYFQFLIFFCLFVSATSSQAQMTMGLRAGINVASYNLKLGSGFSASSQNPGNALLSTIGVPVEMYFNNHFGLQFELNYIQKGFNTHSEITSQNIRSVSDSRLTINWLEIPILGKAKFNITDRIGGGLFFGPSIGYGFSGKSKNSFSSTGGNLPQSFSSEAAVDFKKDGHSQVDFALNFGGEINYGSLFFDVRYQLGLANMLTGSQNSSSGFDFKATTRGFALSVGYRLPIKTETKAPAKTPAKKKS
jgi:Outer membrane protein beta-barrel domain